MSRYTAKDLREDLRDAIDAGHLERYAAVEDRGNCYPHRYTLCVNTPQRGHDYTVAGWPHSWPGTFYKTPREVMAVIHSTIAARGYRTLAQDVAT